MKNHNLLFLVYILFILATTNGCILYTEVTALSEGYSSPFVVYLETDSVIIRNSVKFTILEPEEFCGQQMILYLFKEDQDKFAVSFGEGEIIKFKLRNDDFQNILNKVFFVYTIDPEDIIIIE